MSRPLRRAAPDPGWAPPRRWSAVYLKAPDEGCAASDIASAPSRGEGRALPGPGARAGKTPMSRPLHRAAPGPGWAPPSRWSAVYPESPGRWLCGEPHRQSALPGGGSGAARAGRPGKGCRSPAPPDPKALPGPGARADRGMAAVRPCRSGRAARPSPSRRCSPSGSAPRGRCARSRRRSRPRTRGRRPRPCPIPRRGWR